MASLYKRASEGQTRMLRIVEGAVRDAATHHRDIRISDRGARSIAKRAVGTLTAEMPKVLAGLGQSPAPSAALHPARGKRGALVHASPVRPQGTLGRTSPGAQSGRPRAASPAERAHRAIAKLVRPLRLAGETDRAAGLVEALKILGREMQCSSSASSVSD